MKELTMRSQGSSGRVWAPSGETDYDAALKGVFSQRFLLLRLSTGSATDGTALPDLVEEALFTQDPEYLVLGNRGSGPVLNVDLVNRYWLRLKWSRFAQAGKRARVETALAAIRRATISFGLDAATVRSIAEDPDLEGL